MKMCYDGALVMPSSYAVMTEDEMTYIDGGGDYYINRVGVVAGLIEGFLYLVPSIAAVSQATKLGKGLKAAMLHAKITKAVLINDLAQIAKKVSRRITTNMVSKAVGFVWTVAGLSIGSIIATGLDYVDGTPDGLIFG